ncbi:MAG: zinc ribbon domain-containing protein [Anaerolineaceae bacterium]|nr:zinc ribbon domain-containing protein [Anaerolineaceae bacterium]
MAIIKCPECGKDVSDKAVSCPACGYPIASKIPNGDIQIKIGILKAKNKLQTGQMVLITDSNKQTLWEGKAGDIARIHFEQITTITISYIATFFYWAGYGSGVIDPSKCRKYYTTAHYDGMFNCGVALQETEIFDS